MSTMVDELLRFGAQNADYKLRNSYTANRIITLHHCPFFNLMSRWADHLISYPFFLTNLNQQLFGRFGLPARFQS